MSDSKTGRSSDQFPLRLPDGLRDRLKDVAKRNGRSMNAEIILAIEIHLATEDLNHWSDEIRSKLHPHIREEIEVSEGQLMAQIVEAVKRFSALTIDEAIHQALSHAESKNAPPADD